MIKLLLLIPVFLMFSGCYAQRANLNFSDHGIYTGDSPGLDKFQEIGPVAASDTSWVWKDCDEAMVSTVKDMRVQAEKSGGNRVINVRFYNPDTKLWIKYPVCFKSWGMLMMSSAVQGVAAKVD